MVSSRPGRPVTRQAFPEGEPAQAELRKGAPAKLRGLGALARALDSPYLLAIGAETLAACALPDPDVARIRDGLLDMANAGKPIDRAGVTAHLRQAGFIRAARLLKEYPVTSQIAADGPEAREWLIALEQYVAVGRPGQENPGSGMDDAGGGAFTSPSAWRRRHQMVAERRALKARMNEAAGKRSDS
jgi:DNA primase